MQVQSQHLQQGMPRLLLRDLLLLLQLRLLLALPAVLREAPTGNQHQRGVELVMPNWQQWLPSQQPLSVRHTPVSNMDAQSTVVVQCCSASYAQDHYAAPAFAVQ